MRRRTFITGITGLLATTVAGGARAQQPGKVYRIAIALLAPVVEQRKGAASPLDQMFWGELRRMGFVEGRNLVIERYSPECQSAPKFDPASASNFDPFERRGLTVALGSSELAGIAETRRARVA